MFPAAQVPICNVTLILAQTSRLFALEVSDRLVTRGGSSFDPASNKNVLFLAQDSVVAFGYTGFAYLAGITTDQWITEVLIGEEFERQERPPSLRLGASPLRCAYIGPALQNHWGFAHLTSAPEGTSHA
jgi:hypothetical protein